MPWPRLIINIEKSSNQSSEQQGEVRPHGNMSVSQSVYVEDKNYSKMWGKRIHSMFNVLTHGWVKWTNPTNGLN